MLLSFLQELADKWPFYFAVAIVPLGWMARRSQRLGRWLRSDERGYAVELALVIVFGLWAGFLVYKDKQEALIAAEAVPKRGNIVAQPGIVYHADGGGPASAYVTFVNVGETPVRNLQWSVWLDVADAGFQIRECHQLKGYHAAEGRIDVAPTVTVPRHFERAWAAPDEVAKVVSAEQFLYVCGAYEYSDDFKNNWGGSFCFRYGGYNRARIRVPQGPPILSYPDVEHHPCPDFEPTNGPR